MDLVQLIEKNILFEDNHLIIINKWPGLLSQGDHTGDASLLDLVKEFLKIKYNKPGNVYLGLPHRLDRPVSGAIICCKTSKSMTRVSRMVKEREIDKSYHALCLKEPQLHKGEIISYIKKDESKNLVKNYSTEVKGSKKAILKYQYLKKTKKSYHLMRIQLITGRPHQIRVQLNSIECPILGDIKYSQQIPLPDKSIALHSRELKFIHPISLENLRIIADYPSSPWWKL